MKNRFEEYNKEVMKHFLKPKYSGEMKNPDAIGKIQNNMCGDLMEVYLKIKDDKIQNIKFRTLGCAAAIASSDVLCGLAKGKTLDEAKKITNQDIIKELKSLPSVKLHCSLLGEKTLKDAIEKYEKKKL
jgi:nitrogen fixation protein NifU and related proteins